MDIKVFEVNRFNFEVKYDFREHSGIFKSILTYEAVLETKVALT